MANELAADYLSGKTVYYLIRTATATIWNGVAFEAYQTANYANYDISSTEQGTASGYYVGNFPSIDAGIYYVTAKEQIGGSPAETDITVGTGAIQWNGTTVLPLSYLISTTNYTNIADTILKRDIDNVEATAAVHSLCSALLKLVSKFNVKDSTNSNLATTYRTDGITVHMSQTPTTDATLVATRQLDVAT